MKNDIEELIVFTIIIMYIFKNLEKEFWFGAYWKTYGISSVAKQNNSLESDL